MYIKAKYSLFSGLLAALVFTAPIALAKKGQGGGGNPAQPTQPQVVPAPVAQSPLFAEPVTVNLEGLVKMQTADINQDGLVDILGTRYSDGALVVAINDGQGGFYLNQTFPNHALDFSVNHVVLTRKGFSLGDINSDGSLDIVAMISYRNSSLSSTWTAGVITWLNNGDGSFASGQDLANFPLEPVTGAAIQADAITLADMDGDADLDVVVAVFAYRGKFPGYFAVSENNTLVGDDVVAFADASYMKSKATGHATNIVSEDVDSDGDIDIAMVTHPLQQKAKSNKVSVLRNNGSGSGGNVKAYKMLSNASGRTGAPVVDSLDFVDLNSDGLPDLLVQNGDEYIELRNKSNKPGKFSQKPPVQLVNASSSLVRFKMADTNGDGLSDMISSIVQYSNAGSSKSLGIQVNLGNGSGGFEGGSSNPAALLIQNQIDFPVSAVFYDMAMGDFDADGDADIFVNNYQKSLYSAIPVSNESLLFDNLSF